MSYNPTMVLLPWSGVGGLTLLNSLCGFPSTFTNFLFSTWYCLGKDGFRRVWQVSNTVTFFNITVNLDTVQIALVSSINTPLFSGNFAVNSFPYRCHVLISVDVTHRVIQVYLNDTPLTLTSGGWTGTGTSFHLTTLYSNWDITGAGSASPGSGIADVYVAAPSDFYDLNSIGNRRKFINADLTPVNLQPNATGPLGGSPQIFLTVQPGNPVTDFATNYGIGPSFNIGTLPLAFQVDGSCSPLIGVPLSAGVIATPEIGHITFLPELKLVSLYSMRPTDDVYAFVSGDD